MAAALAGLTANDHRRLARDAIALGCAALESGDFGRALPFLERAYRIAPRDPTAAMLLAGADPARAETVLAAALSHHPGHRAILAALAAAALRNGDPSEASARLHAMLSSGSPLPGQDFIELATRIARDSGAPGWIALSGDGTLQVSGRATTLRVGGVRHALAPGLATRTLVLRDGWQAAGYVTAETRSTPFIGSPIDIGALLLVEGCVTGQGAGTLCGWAWHPNDPDRPPVLRLVDASGVEIARMTADRATPAMPGGDGADRDRGFRFDLADLAVTAAWPLQVHGPDARILPGGMVYAGEAEASRAAAASLAAQPRDPWRPIPAMFATASSPPAKAAARGRGVAVVLSLDEGTAQGVASSLQSIAESGARLVTVSGQHAGPAARHLVEAQGGVCVDVPGATAPALLNAGLRAVMKTPPRTVLLLAQPAILPRGLSARLAACWRAHPTAGLAQPLFGPTVQTALRDRMARRLNEGWRGTLTVADGPVLAIDTRCLLQTGLLREASFTGAAAALADFSARARHLGWLTVIAGDLYAGVPQETGSPHVREALASRDQNTLERLHPGIAEIIAAQQSADPGAAARRRLAMAEWAAGTGPGGSVIFVTHADGGGIERHVRQSAAAVQAQGRRAVVIRPGDDKGAFWSLSDGTGVGNPDLRFRAPGEFAAMTDLLRMDRPVHVELHHSESHDPAICGLAPALGIPYDVFVHDFAMICPRVTLIGGTGRYCGEPVDVTECDDCVADHGVRIGQAAPVAGLRARSAALAAGARRIVAPSRDSARRILRQWQIDLPAPQVEPWEDDTVLAADVPRRPVRAATAGPVMVCLAGAIGQDKGFDVLLACARDAARRRLNLAFRVVGHTIDDKRLIDTGRVFITGEYEEHEAVALIRAQHADIGFLPSVWPETWCYALSALWRAGLWTVAFALGAQAERIAATGAGRTVPLGMPAGRLNDLFLELFPAGAAAHG